MANAITMFGLAANQELECVAVFNTALCGSSTALFVHLPNLHAVSSSPTKECKHFEVNEIQQEAWRQN